MLLWIFIYLVKIFIDNGGAYWEFISICEYYANFIILLHSDSIFLLLFSCNSLIQPQSSAGKPLKMAWKPRNALVHIWKGASLLSIIVTVINLSKYFTTVSEWSLWNILCYLLPPILPVSHQIYCQRIGKIVPEEKGNYSKAPWLNHPSHFLQFWQIKMWQKTAMSADHQVRRYKW